MTIIVYSSKSGSSEAYAKSLAARTGLVAYPVGSHPGGEPIVFIGRLRMDIIVGLSRVDRSEVIAVGAVGIDPEERFDRGRVSERNGLNVPLYYLRGWVDRSRLGPFDKGALAMIAAMMKLRGLDERSRPVFDAMMEGGSFYDERYLDQMQTFIGSRRARGSPVRIRTGGAGSKGQHV